MKASLTSIVFSAVLTTGVIALVTWAANITFAAYDTLPVSDLDHQPQIVQDL